ncbi:MAG TPA: M81 family metallopeptidase [Alphaproteobacteria bacterium]|nr:M81 family metallopeptidase [Alphaproteobacteria bacterium]
MSRVLIASIMHETNTFSRLATDLEAFHRRYDHRGDAVPGAFRGTRSEMGAFLDAAEEHGWAPAHPVAAAATPSGTVTAAAWESLSGAVIAALDRPFDGILLALHGAMVAEGAEDAEGDLLARIRARVGAKVPIAITLDLHANVTDRMAAHANIIIAYRSYPHVDQYERGRQAADLLARAMGGEIAPRSVVARRPTLDGVDHGRTTDPASPMLEVLARAAAYEKEPGIHAVSVHAGFAWADIAEAGPSVSVSGDGDPARLRAVAETLMDEVWRTRHVTTLKLVPVAEAIAHVKRSNGAQKPIVLADFTDNPGGGGYGDATNLLRGMIEAGLENAAFAPITDPEAVQRCREAGEGARVTLAIGGKIDPAFGAPLQVTGTVLRLGDGDFVCDGPMWKGLKMSMGPAAVLRVGGVEIVLASNRFQITDPQHFLSLGIDPRRKAVIGLKSAQHFRAAYQPMASEVIVVDSGALTTPDYRRFAYRKLRRPIWPLDAL